MITKIIVIFHLALSLFCGVQIYRNTDWVDKSITDTVTYKYIKQDTKISPNRDTIYVKDTILASQLKYVWTKYPIDSIKPPKIVVIK